MALGPPEHAEPQPLGDARSNIVIWEHRRGTTDHYVGWQEHRLVGGAGRWRVRKKAINLLDADEPQGNVTFIL